LDIEQRNVINVIIEHFEAFFGTRGCVDLVVFAHQNHAHGSADIFFIIDNENIGIGHGVQPHPNDAAYRR
jgi:hypothetical protein